MILLIHPLAVVGSASADGELQVELPGGAPLFDLDDLHPGSLGSAQMVVTNAAGGPADLVITVIDLVEDDNGCNGPEVEVGDITCGADGGELGRDVQITVRETVSASALWTGSLRELSQAVILGSVLPGQELLSLTFDYRFDPASGNDTQTDRVSFDIQIGLQDRAQVTGASVTRVAGAQLPRTGLPLEWVPVAFTAVLAGAVLVIWGRRRRLLCPPTTGTWWASRCRSCEPGPPVVAAGTLCPSGPSGPGGTL